MNQSDNTRAALMMTGSMLAFAFEDLFLKRAAGGIAPGQIILMLGLGGMVIFWGLAALRGQKILSMRAFHPAAFIRSACEGIASILYILALASLPLSTVSALLQASPLAVTMGAALLLREQVGWRRWSAVAVGFIGVLVILRPSDEGISIHALMLVACVLSLAGRDLATRVMPADITTMQLSTWAYIAMALAGLGLTLGSGDGMTMPASRHLLDIFLAVTLGCVGYWAVTAAMRIGEISAIAPFRYTRLVFAMTLAVIFLGEHPDIWTLAGSALVIASGLYTFWRETRRKALSKESANR